MILVVSNYLEFLQMDVAKLEEQMYQLQISCQRALGVLVQLTQALESMDLDVLNAHHSSFQESILNTSIVEVPNVGLIYLTDLGTIILYVTFLQY
jgi:hypothetical protein